MSSDTPYGDPQTRCRILDAAWHLLEEQGIGFTMGEVAEQAGVSRQAVYLHVEDRSGLLVALVGHIDQQLGLARRSRPVRRAASGREALEELVALHADYTEEIIGMARLLDNERETDAAVAAAWEDRMAGRRAAHREVIERLVADDQLADGWDVDSAATLFYAVTLPRIWDELVDDRGWTPAQYREHLTQLLVDAFVADP